MPTKHQIQMQQKLLEKRRFDDRTNLNLDAILATCVGPDNTQERTDNADETFNEDINDLSDFLRDNFEWMVTMSLEKLDLVSKLALEGQLLDIVNCVVSRGYDKDIYDQVKEVTAKEINRILKFAGFPLSVTRIEKNAYLPKAYKELVHDIVINAGLQSGDVSNWFTKKVSTGLLQILTHLINCHVIAEKNHDGKVIFTMGKCVTSFVELPIISNDIPSSSGVSKPTKRRKNFKTNRDREQSEVTPLDFRAQSEEDAIIIADNSYKIKVEVPSKENGEFSSTEEEIEPDLARESESNTPEILVKTEMDLGLNVDFESSINGSDSDPDAPPHFAVSTKIMKTEPTFDEDSEESFEIPFIDIKTESNGILPDFDDD